MLLMLSCLGSKSINKLTDQRSEILNMQQFITNCVFFVVVENRKIEF